MATTGYRVGVTSYSDRAEYRRIADALRDRILSGHYSPGELLPSQADLMRDWRVSVTTAREAIAVLRGEGLVEAIRGIGVRVRQPPAVRVVSSNRYADQLRLIAAGDHTAADSAFARDHGAHTADTTIDCEFGAVDAPEHVARALGIPAGSPVFRRYMVWRLDGDAEQVRTCYHPLDLVDGTPMADPARQPWPGGVIAELAALGQVVVDVRERVRTRMALPDEAVTLRISGGVPVMVVHRVGTAQSGRVVEVAEIILPGDRIELDYHLRLDHDAP